MASAPLLIFGWTDNPAGLDFGASGVQLVKTTSFNQETGFAAVHCQANIAPPSPPSNPPRPDIVFEDFEGTTYDGWTATGTAFGSGPTHTLVFWNRPIASGVRGGRSRVEYWRQNCPRMIPASHLQG
jgi:hypothetical protein